MSTFIFALLLSAAPLCANLDPFEPTSYNLMLENSLAFDEHYQNAHNNPRIFDLYFNPFYRYTTIQGAHFDAHAAGAFIKAQATLGNFYLAAITAANSLHTPLGNSIGLADIMLKAGYDFLLSHGHHVGLYALAGFPTGHSLELSSIKIDPSSSLDNTFDCKVTLPYIGGHHYIIGFGLNAGINLYEQNEDALRLLLDARYRCALPRSHTDSNLVDIRSHAHIIDLWTAFHYQHDMFHFEFGNVLTPRLISAQSRIKTENLGSLSLPTALRAFPILSTTFATLTTKPYAAFSINGLLGDCPAMIGLGVGYEFSTIQIAHIHGATAWLTTGISF